MNMTWDEYVKKADEIFCEHCGYGFEAGEWVYKIDGYYYHQGCVHDCMGFQIPEPPEPDEDRAYDEWRDRQLERLENEQ